MTPNLLCGHSDVYSATLPPSGIALNGALYEHQTSEHHTTANGSSSSPGAMIPTPTATDGADDWEILCEDCTEFYTGICCTFETEIEALTVAAEHARMNLIAVIPEEETVILPDGESIGIKINKKETQSRD